MHAALVRDGIVENVIVVGSDYNPGSGFKLVPLGERVAGPGWGWDGDDFTPPVSEQPEALPVPEAVTARQARLALLGAGVLGMVEQALASMPGVEGDVARIEWEYAQEIRRDSPLIGALAPALGLTGEQVDDLFRSAESL